ncbi:MAG: NADH-quinone oxidoreductase subunit C [Acidimicrobiia bacterium]|nr:NADH-quinone oxidoreductase subunit C [Acidimicrobiia bacterium]
MEPGARYGALVADISSQPVLFVTPANYLQVAGAAFEDGFDQLIDLTAVDYLSYPGQRPRPADVVCERFELVVQLINHASRERLGLRVQVPTAEPRVPSLFDLWPGAENLEREVFDMFGIEFVDHPDMSRILMPEDWVGHPLRKDYGVGDIAVQFSLASAPT